jgi:hypothetical protein
VQDGQQIGACLGEAVLMVRSLLGAVGHTLQQPRLDHGVQPAAEHVVSHTE